MKIVLIVTCLGVGGAETQVVNLADRLDACGHEILLISLTNELLVLPASRTVQVVSLDIKKSPASLARAYWQASRRIRQFGPAVVHSHMVHANLFSRLLRLCTPIPRLICTAHSINEGGALRMWLYRVTDPLAHMTTNVSQAALDRYLACSAMSAHKALAVYNGIDCEHFHYDPALREAVRAQFHLLPGTEVLLAVGRICEAKDYANLIKAFADASAQRADCVLWIAGTGDDRSMAEINALVDSLGIREKTRILGLRRDVHALMCAADVFVISSCLEGFPLVVGEAMACERVVVSTDAGGTSEWLGSTGYTVPIRDSGALAGALLQALDLDDENRHLQGAAARERVLAHYSLTAVVQRWERIYRGNDAADESGVGGALVEAEQQAH